MMNIKSENILCVATVLVIILVLLHFFKTFYSREKYADLNVELTVGNNLMDSNVAVCGKMLSAREYLTKRNHGRCLNLQRPGEVSSREGCMPVNLSSRDIDGGFYQQGVLEKVRDSADPSKSTVDELPLYQRRKPTDFSKMLYYTTDNYLEPLKFPIQFKGMNCQGEDGCAELQHGDLVEIPELNASYRVRRCSDALAKISNKCVPKYYPDRYYTRNPPVLLGTEW